MDPKRKCLLDYFSSNATSSQSSNPEFNLNIDDNYTTMQETLLVDPGSVSNQDSSYTVVIAYKNTGYKNISVIRTISPGNRFSSYSFVLEEYRL